MPRITDIMLLEQPEMPTLVVRTRTRIQDMPLLIGKTYGSIAAYLGELGHHMAGIPFVAYYNMDMQDLDVDLGFPVAGRLPGKGDIQAGTIPAGLMVTSLYQGAYSGLQGAYAEMAVWIQEGTLAAMPVDLSALMQLVMLAPPVQKITASGFAFMMDVR